MEASEPCCINPSLRHAPGATASAVAQFGLSAYAYAAARVGVPFCSSSRNGHDVNGEW
ncbi:hypothetical protein NY78_1066 [Desulfovibrio sp. TomC]|nr:hypothetical protein NY78_1066 [Desulfovibrio sp. TomC]